MAFMGMVFATIFILIFIFLLISSVAFLIISFVLKRKAVKKDSKKLRIAGNVLRVLGVLNAIPVIAVIGFAVYSNIFIKIDMPNGKTKNILRSYVTQMTELEDENTAESTDKLIRLLDKVPELVYYYDINHKSVLEKALFNGNYKLVEAALERGSTFDNPQRYDHMAYVHTSMSDYLNEVWSRSITNDDVKIIKLMFDKGASAGSPDTVPDDSSIYTNKLGYAAWVVLYNDEAVTDTEIEFVQVFIDNGFSKDDGFLLLEEKPSNVIVDVNSDVKKDDNYYKLLKMLNKKVP